MIKSPDLLVLKQVSAIKWSADLEAFPSGLFHCAEWVYALSGKQTPAIFLNFESPEGEVLGKLSGLILPGNRLMGRKLYFFSSLLLRGRDKQLRSVCMEALQLYARREGFSRVLIYSFDARSSECLSFKGYYCEAMHEFVIDFSKSGGHVKMSSNLKRNAKKAIKAGVKIHRSTSISVLKRMMDLLLVTKEERRQKYGQDYNPMYIQNMNETSLGRLLDSGIGVMYYSELDGEINTVLFALENPQQLYFLLMGSDRVAYENGIPALVAQHVSHYAREVGKIYYNLGVIPRENSGGAGVRQFKQQQGAIEQMGHCYYSQFLKFPARLFNFWLKRRFKKNESTRL
ncbi:GNAT family N-acetyltransferase [Geofilum rubicundum]|uniref:BioF2-like acetyltransferase domain-containing protein n=1 Tax=Geofilum rubicundum JCM 15548 TaxID=1236989 RepID=A0A0E9LTC5_9BACT|nr:GNAT family N-acetyltransferase [Geofilum rubicundum]GAO28499.1 hypothetical protein JCM15548_1604 [Geofilum rubicundum JCM 15548]